MNAIDKSFSKRGVVRLKRRKEFSYNTATAGGWPIPLPTSRSSRTRGDLVLRKNAQGPGGGSGGNTVSARKGAIWKGFMSEQAIYKAAGDVLLKKKGRSPFSKSQKGRFAPRGAGSQSGEKNEFTLSLRGSWRKEYFMKGKDKTKFDLNPSLRGIGEIWKDSVELLTGSLSCKKGNCPGDPQGGRCKKTSNRAKQKALLTLGRDVERKWNRYSTSNSLHRGVKVMRERRKSISIKKTVLTLKGGRLREKTHSLPTMKGEGIHGGEGLTTKGKPRDFIRKKPRQEPLPRKWGKIKGETP